MVIIYNPLFPFLPRIVHNLIRLRLLVCSGFRGVPTRRYVYSGQYKEGGPPLDIIMLLLNLFDTTLGNPSINFMWSFLFDLGNFPN